MLLLCLLVLAALAGCFGLQIVLVSGVQERAAQHGRFDRFREALAKGTAPVGPIDSDGRLLDEGAPVALLEIPKLGVKQVVGEGTTSGALTGGPGHRRDTPVPGAAGTSVVYGRNASYGAPFRHLAQLRSGNIIRVTNGLGRSTFKVVSVRKAGDPLPDPLAAGKGRLLLVTAAGTPFLPDGVLRVDADLDGDAVTATRSTLRLTKAEQPMQGDQGTLWALVLWLQAGIAVAVAASWSWARWGRIQTWTVFVPLGLLVGLSIAGQVVKLLPNLL